jgi:hypothetical protein
VIAPSLLAIVVLLQHRTVWVVTILGIVYLLFRERAIATRLVGVLVAAFAVFAVLVFTVFGGNDDVADQLAGSAQRTDTFEWRVWGGGCCSRTPGRKVSPKSRPAGPTAPVGNAASLPDTPSMCRPTTSSSNRSCG